MAQVSVAPGQIMADGSCDVPLDSDNWRKECVSGCAPSSDLLVCACFFFFLDCFVVCVCGNVY